MGSALCRFKKFPCFIDSHLVDLKSVAKDLEVNMLELEIEIPTLTPNKRKGLHRSRSKHAPSWMPLIVALFSRLEYPLNADGDPHVISTQKIDGMPSLRDFL